MIRQFEKAHGIQPETLRLSDHGAQSLRLDAISHPGVRIESCGTWTSRSCCWAHCHLPVEELKRQSLLLGVVVVGIAVLLIVMQILFCPPPAPPPLPPAPGSCPLRGTCKIQAVCRPAKASGTAEGCVFLCSHKKDTYT